MSYARDKRKGLIRKMKKDLGKKWKTVYLAKARQIRMEKIFAKEVFSNG